MTLPKIFWGLSRLKMSCTDFKCPYMGEAGELFGICSCKIESIHISHFRDLCKVNGPAGDLTDCPYEKLCSCGYTALFCHCTFCDVCGEWENKFESCKCKRCGKCDMKVLDYGCGICETCNEWECIDGCKCEYCTHCGFKTQKCTCSRGGAYYHYCIETGMFELNTECECQSCARSQF